METAKLSGGRKALKVKIINEVVCSMFPYWCQKYDVSTVCPFTGM